ncbi:MAG: SIMPL domain-containing protein [Thermomicrobiales bacterium]
MGRTRASSRTLRALRFGASLALLAPLAGTVAAAPASGITVQGYGDASTVAKAAQVQLLLSRGDPGFNGNVARLRPGTRPGDEERKLAEPIVDAVVAAGVAKADVAVIVSALPPNQFGGYGPGGPGLARIDFALADPTPERIAKLLGDAGVAADAQSLSIGAVGIRYDAADCAALQGEARAAALKDARARAEAQATALGVKVGAIAGSEDLESAAMNLNVYGLAGLTGSNCDTTNASQNFPGDGLAITFASYSATNDGKVEVEIRVTVTFGIL